MDRDLERSSALADQYRRSLGVDSLEQQRFRWQFEIERIEKEVNTIEPALAGYEDRNPRYYILTASLTALPDTTPPGRITDFRFRGKRPSSWWLVFVRR